MAHTLGAESSHEVTEVVAVQGAPFVQASEPWAYSNFASVVAVALLAGIVIGRKTSQARDISSVDSSHAHLPSGDWKGDLEVVHGCESWQLNETQFCPVCRAEYIPPTTLCEDCGVDLVEEDDMPEMEPRIEECVVRVARIPRSSSGQFLRGYLAANHIPCMVTRSSPWDVIGADVFVFESDALRVKKLLRYYLADLDATLV